MRELAPKGWQLVGVSRGKQHSGDTYTRLPDIKTVRGSVADPRVIDEAFRVASNIGELLLVVNCAGSAQFGQAGDSTAHQIIETINANFTGLTLFTNKAIEVMSDKPGTIVNVMSTAAKRLPHGQAIYAASKWGAKAYTRAVQRELEARGSSIRIVQVYPCGMRTEFWNGMDPSQLPDFDDYAKPSDIAHAIVNTVLPRTHPYIAELVFHR